MKKGMKYVAGILCALQLCMCESTGFAMVKNITAQIQSPNVQFTVLTIIHEDKDKGITGFDKLTIENLPSVLHSVQTREVIPGINSVIYTVTLDNDEPKGTYLTRMTYVCENPEDTYSEYGAIYHLSDVQLAEKTAEVHRATDPMEGLEILAAMGVLDERLFAEAQSSQDFVKLFSAVRAEKYTDGYSGTGIKDVEDNVRFALALDAFRSLDADKLKLYIAVTDFSRVFMPEEVDTDKLLYEDFAATYVANRDSEVTLVSKLISDINIATGIMLLKGGSPAEKTETLNQYGTILGLNLQKAKDEKIELLDIAKRIQGSDLIELRESYESVLKQLVKEKSEKNKTPRPSSGGSTGGGTGGGFSVPTKTTVKTDKPQNMSTKEENNRQHTFRDVETSNWAYDAITALTEKNIISAEAEYFRGENGITRAEFLKLAVLAFGIEMKGAELEFEDCIKSDWYYPYVCAGYNAGIVTGQSDTSFGAQTFITREDAAVIANRIFGWKTAKNAECNFADQHTISDYASGAVANLSERKLLIGFADGNFRPQARISRYEAAVLFYRLMQYSA